MWKLRASLQHYLFSSLVIAFGLCVGVEQAQALHDTETQLPREKAGFAMPQKLSYLTVDEVEVTLALVPIFGLKGILRYPTKPIPVEVHVLTMSYFTYLHGDPLMCYEHVSRDMILSSEVPHAYTTIKNEQQLEENMMGTVRALTRKTSPLPTEYGTVY